MQLLELLISRFDEALATITEQHAQFAAMVRGSADPQFGDYQCNAAMPLSKRIGEKDARVVAARIVDALDVGDVCERPTIAGPGFINLRLRDDLLLSNLRGAAMDPHLGISSGEPPKKVIVDFSSPNVAKPMHVGHIRSTVIGDCLARLLRFLGDEVITDNHLGDWGTQFGIIIYGYKHFGDPAKVDANPVPELTSLYRLTNQLIEYHKAKDSLGQLRERLQDATEQDRAAQTASDQAADDSKRSDKEKKKTRKQAAASAARVKSIQKEIASAEAKLAAVEQEPRLNELAQQHPDIAQAVLRETAKLHQGDPENLALWKRFLPHCKDEINRIYDRLHVTFDHTLGESFYHDRLPGVVATLQELGLTQQSDGAVCVFLDGFDSPMIVQKSDGAYLYATTDLATLVYRQEVFGADEILYVVDTRQGEHFEKFFALAEPLGIHGTKLVHVNFGTVLGSDGRPMKTRSGSLIGLESLLDDAVERAREVACDPERLAAMDPPMDEAEQHRVAEVIGIGAIKYADLSHHRASDYKFDVEKMVALDGNTATYIQYSYARTQSILRKAMSDSALSPLVDVLRAQEAQLAIHPTTDGSDRAPASSAESVHRVAGRMTQSNWPLQFTEPAERALAMMLIRLEEALESARGGYSPNVICDYLYDTAKVYSTFNETCRVLGHEDMTITKTRLFLVSLTGRTLRCGLALLGIDVVERM